MTLLILQNSNDGDTSSPCIVVDECGHRRGQLVKRLLQVACLY